MRWSWFILPVSLILLGCNAATEEARIAHFVDPAPTAASFRVCHGSNCSVRTPVALSDEEWSRIAAVFEREADDPADERRNIARAVALFETMVGPKANTSSDVGRNRAVPDQSTQLDCIDESVNTTTYLTLIENAGLLRWHDVALPAHREAEWLDFHNTAVIVERDNGARWAVDSWFASNGQPPSIVVLDAWIAGWSPGMPLPAMAEATPSEPAP